MIDRNYINSAIKIRQEYLDLNSKILEYDSNIKKVGQKISDISSDLENIKNNMSTYKSIDDVNKEVTKKLETLDKESKSIENWIIPMNQRMEELSKMETNLYIAIKEKYPDMTDEEIVNEITPFITK
jgi:prefoldin subunit 5